MEKTYKILKLLIAVLLFAVIIVGAYVLYQHLSADYMVGITTVQPGQPEETPETGATEAAKVAVPDFTFYDVDQHIDLFQISTLEIHRLQWLSVHSTYLYGMTNV